MSGFVKVRMIDRAAQLFDQMPERDVFSWSTMISGYTQREQPSMALDHAGMVDLGKRYFESMKSEHKVNPDIKHYGCMVDLLGRSGQLEEAEKLIKSMPMEADVVIWGTLLSACRTHENVDVGKRAAENLARLEPSHGASRVLLSNLYADAGKWEDAFSVRKTMHSNRIQRLPGYSGVI
ncbi:Pentatricopeptide repeat-containing protein At5g19020, mitochondrial [Linum perenne]